jgi:hypothetical protein
MDYMELKAAATKGLGIGRVVHYVDYNGKHLAALVTDIDPLHEVGRVWLTIFDPKRELPHHAEIMFDPEKRAGTWHWPESVA